ncbi:hypothetical protein N7491_010825 [Penicillium cf. griseofulvum]|nr:hypothetical protein N7491_010825 [Penicillium cf. griseofulvum]
MFSMLHNLSSCTCDMLSIAEIRVQRLYATATSPEVASDVRDRIRYESSTDKAKIMHEKGLQCEHAVEMCSNCNIKMRQPNPRDDKKDSPKSATSNSEIDHESTCQTLAQREKPSSLISVDSNVMQHLCVLIDDFSQPYTPQSNI